MGTTNNAAFTELLLVRGGVPQQTYGRHALRRGSDPCRDGPCGSSGLSHPGNTDIHQHCSSNKGIYKHYGPHVANRRIQAEGCPHNPVESRSGRSAGCDQSGSVLCEGLSRRNSPGSSRDFSETLTHIMNEGIRQPVNWCKSLTLR